MILPAGLPIPAGTLIQPRAEPEIAFLLDRPLRGPGVDAAQAIAAVGLVFGAMEIIDSRFSGYKFTLATPRPTTPRPGGMWWDPGASRRPCST
jgi:2-oxo-3-hexenedioate decarboxylase